MQCHHIVPEADRGPDTFENCIPLCPDCHAEVMAFNPRHPFGATPYHASELIRRRDDWYAAISRRTTDISENLHRTPLFYPHSPALRGKASFNYSHHDGFYRLGEGNNEFLTRWIKSSDTSIQCYKDRTNVSIALPPKSTLLSEIHEASLLNYSSRVRRPQLGEFIVFENHRGRYAAAQILRIADDTRNGATEDLLEFNYWILGDGGDDFLSAQ